MDGMTEKTESWALTEIDRSVSGGVSRSKAQAGDAVRTPSAWPLFCTYISAFLAAGGYGDGRLNYRPEQIVERYYALHAPAGWTITGDFQRTANPAYNLDRGRVSVAIIRLHWEH